MGMLWVAVAVLGLAAGAFGGLFALLIGVLVAAIAGALTSLLVAGDGLGGILGTAGLAALLFQMAAAAGFLVRARWAGRRIAGPTGLERDDDRLGSAVMSFRRAPARMRRSGGIS